MNAEARYRARRRLGGLLVLSGLLHGGLAAYSGFERTAPRSAETRLWVSLRGAGPQTLSSPPPPVPQAAAPVPPVAPRQPGREVRPLRPAVPSAPVLTSAAVPAAAQGPADVTPVSAATPAVEPAGSLPGGANAPASAEPPPTAPRQGSDPLGDYRRKLVALLARPRDYPPLAAMRGWEGEVRLLVRIARKGNLLAVSLERSSGFGVLDRHALAVLERQGDFPPLPERWEGNEMQLVVPIQYTLRKEI